MTKIGAAKAKVRLIRQILAESSAPNSCDKIFRDMITATLWRMPMEALEALARAPFVFFAPANVFGAAFPVAQLRLPKSREGFVVFLSMDILREPPIEDALFYVAHELAHVLLRHGVEDPTFGSRAGAQRYAEANEQAADELARSWGFAVPLHRQNAKRGDNPYGGSVIECSE
jgi:hypothetical protein